MRFIAILLGGVGGAALGGCGALLGIDDPGGGIDGGDDGDAPRVIATVPEAGAIDVAPEVAIAATFSIDMDPATLDESTMVVTLGGAAVDGVVSYDPGSRTARFEPAARLTLFGDYQLAVAGEVASAAGIPMGEPYLVDFAVRDGAWDGVDTIETGAADGDAPQVGIDAAGNAIAVWHQLTGARRDVWWNRYTAGAGWGTAALLETDDAGDAINPAIAVAPSGEAVAVWEQSDGTRSNIWARRFTVAGGWADATLVETDGAGPAVRADVGIDDAGAAIAVWYQSDGTRNNIRASRQTATGAWSAPDFLESAAATAQFPKIAVGPTGPAIAVWHQSDGTATSIWANHYTVANGWEASGTLIETASGQALTPSIAIDGNGRGWAAWSQDAGAGDDDAWAARYTVSSGWGDPVELENAAGDAGSVRIAMNRAGDAVAVWAQSDGTRHNAHANRWLVGGGWEGEALIEVAADGNTGLPSVAIDAAAHAIAAWHKDDGTFDNVWSNRLTTASGWAVADTLETQNLGDAELPRVAGNETGEVVVVWAQHDGTRSNVRASVFH